jgi:hypothetical protein
MKKKKYKSVIKKRINQSLKRIELVFLLLTISFGYLGIKGTASYFTDTGSIWGSTFSASKWLPEISMNIAPSEPDGEDGRYQEAPCIKLYSDIDEVEFNYTFSGLEETSGTIQADTCIFPPSGDTVFFAFAVSTENPTWQSEAIGHEFKVGPVIDHFGAIVINEIMWMGSSEHPRDEWIELRNMSPMPVDISGWKIENILVGNKTLIIPTGSEIPANGYFLISRDNEPKKSAVLAEPNLIEKMIRLKDRNNQTLVLKNETDIVIDSAFSANDWPAGWHGHVFHLSMSRTAVPGDGNDPTSWYTSLNRLANDTLYWQSEGTDYGTPGQANLPLEFAFSNNEEQKEIDNFKNHFEKDIPELSETEDEDENSENKKAQPVIERFNDIDNEENDDKNKNNQDGSCADDCATEESPDTAPAIINETDNSDNPETPEAQAPLTDLLSEAPIPTDQDLETDKDEPVIEEKAETTEEIPTENLAPEIEEKVPENQTEKAEIESIITVDEEE